MNLISAKLQYISIRNTFIIYNIDTRKHNIIKFKNENIYINHVMDHIKDKILKNYPSLKHIRIKIELFDQSNSIHCFIINVMKYGHIQKKMII